MGNRIKAIFIALFFSLAVAGCGGSNGGNSEAEERYASGVAIAKEGKLAGAIVEYASAIGLNPQFALTYNNRGSAYGALGRHAKAFQDSAEAMRLDPHVASPHYNRGNIHRDLGQHERAIADYDAAIRLDPRFAFAYINRPSSYRGLGQVRRAIEDLSEAIRLTPRTPTPTPTEVSRTPIWANMREPSRISTRRSVSLPDSSALTRTVGSPTHSPARTWRPSETLMERSNWDSTQWSWK